MTTILLVEDNELNRDMLSRRLERHHFNIIFANNGKEGFDSARAHQPDVILMDMSLPVMDGWEATSKIKQEITTAHIPIIGLSAHAMSGDKEKAIKAGCDDYDTKPVDLPRLLNKISSFTN
ncbi:MAG: response regulator [Gammaproteobacteria bacterium]|nr:response regulator [Gammaproteobacteria bacterium]